MTLGRVRMLQGTQGSARLGAAGVGSRMSQTIDFHEEMGAATGLVVTQGSGVRIPARFWSV